MHFIDLDGAYVFTLGLDACEPHMHRTGIPRIVSVGNKDICFLEAVKCSASDGMFFHEHRLIPEDTSKPRLVTRAVEQYCSQLQNPPAAPLHEEKYEDEEDEAEQEAMEIPTTSASSSQAMPEKSAQSARVSSTRRFSPYPDILSLLQRRSAPLRAESSTALATSADVAPSTSTGRLTIPTPKASRGASESMTLQGLLQSGPPARPIDQLTSLLEAPPAIPAGASRQVSSQGSALPSISGALQALGFRVPSTSRKPVTNADKAKIVDYCIRYHVGQTVYQAYTHLNEAFKVGRIQLNYLPSRVTVGKILADAGHVKTKTTMWNRVIKTITREPQVPMQPLERQEPQAPESQNPQPK